MPTLYITEFGGLQADPASPSMSCPVLPSLANQAVVFTDVSAQSAAMGAATRLVRVMADADCFIASGANPTAVTQTPLAAGAPEYFQVPMGQSLKIAAITRA